MGTAKKKNLGASTECPNLKDLARFSDWRDTSAKAAYYFYIRVTSERATKVSYDNGKRENFVLNDEGEWVVEK